jgi:hypothetical protein
LAYASRWKIHHRGGETGGVPAPVRTITQQRILVTGDRRMVVAAADKATSCRDDVLKGRTVNRDLEHSRIIGRKHTPLLQVKVVSKAHLRCRRVIHEAWRVEPVIKNATSVLAEGGVW